MTETAIAEPPAAVIAISPWPAILHRAVGWSLFFAVVAAALAAGLVLRRWAWDQTEPIRYVQDINNAFRQGTQALRYGYFERYDQQESRSERDSMMDLDYAPGRLAVATLWSKWVWSKWAPAITDYRKLPEYGPLFYPHARLLKQQYELCKPMLMVNMTGEILSAIAMFFLVRRYTVGKPPLYRPVRGNVLGLIAALFFWFDPALICNAHCWPQWDSWVLPFFLWAVLLASLDWWFCSGLLIATGAMFKGQILFGAPVFLLWPLFQGKIPAMARWVVGLLFAVAMVTVVWMVRVPGTTPTGRDYIPGSINQLAITWLVYWALVIAAMPALLWWPRHPQARIPVLVLLVAIATWIIASHTSHTFSVIGFLALAGSVIWLDQGRPILQWQLQLPLIFLAMVILLWPVHVLADSWLPEAAGAIIAMGILLYIAPRQALPYAAAAWMSAAVLTCMPVFGASQGWFHLGFANGTQHYERMANGQLDNLPELLQEEWGWDNLMAPAVTIPPGRIADDIAEFLPAIDRGVKLTPGAAVDLPLKYFLVGLWLIAVVVCALAAAIHDRNRSPRFLAAIAAPWIVFFCVMTQMHQRYLLWGSSISSATAILSPGYAILHLFLSIVSVTQELHSMMNNGLDPNHPVRYTDNQLYQFIDHWHPGVAWAVLLTAGIFVYTAVKWEKRANT